MFYYCYDVQGIFTQQRVAVIDVPETKRLRESDPSADPIYLKLPNTTLVEMPAPEEGFTFQFDEDNQAWNKVEDHRNKIVYHKQNRYRIRVNQVGAIADEFTLDQPKEFDFWDDESNSWKENLDIKIKTCIANLWSAANRYQENRISSSGFAVLFNYRQTPKAAAIINWIDSLWADYYARKAQLTAENFEISYDFSSNGELPETFLDARAEIEASLVS